MKKKSKQSPIWPYLGILGCLFLLSLTAPRAWERRAQRNVTAARSQAVAVRTSPLTTPTEVPVVPVHELETSDASELAPREEAVEFSEPLRVPAADAAQATTAWMPPAPFYADAFELPTTPSFDLQANQNYQLPTNPTIELAHLPQAPAAPRPAEPDAPADELEFAVPEEPATFDDAPLEVQPASPIAPPAPAIEAPVEMPLAEEPAETEPQAEPKVETRVAVWPLPRHVLEELSTLAFEDEHLIWVPRATQLVNELCFTADDEPHRRATLAALRKLVTVDALQPGTDVSLEPQITRVRYGLTRWLDVWESVDRLSRESIPVANPSELEARMRAKLAAFDALASTDPAGDSWRAYLDLEALRNAAAANVSSSLRSNLARRTLDRLGSRKLSVAQRKFIEQGGIAELREELEIWAAAQFEPQRLLTHLEQLEYSGLASDAAVVADDYHSVSVLPTDAAGELARHLDTHYRNANLRVAMSGDFANRLVPQPGRIDAPVRDTVVNVPVRGHSSTFTKLSVKLVPDPQRIRLGLEAHGTVDANTVSDAGPARFRNRGQATFLVRKLFVFGPKGLLVWPAIAEAENNFNYLVSMETDFDKVPLVGSMVRNIARTQHDELSGQARRQTEAKVAIRALHQLDSEVETRLAEAERKMNDSQGVVLKRLGMEITPISLATTEDRMVGRLRLAGRDQLGAYTPRPRAPSDSWLSMQVHQSAMNNTLESLDLEGRRFELAELFAWVGHKLGRPELANQEDLPENVNITFADHDAIRVQAVDDRIEVTFALAELTHEGTRWRNFQVRTHYAPEIDGISPRFARVDTIHLDGPSVRGKIQFKLRAIFSKVLSKNRDLHLLPDNLTRDPRLKDLQITQFVVEDGWIGLAFSPRRVSSKVARKPE